MKRTGEKLELSEAGETKRIKIDLLEEEDIDDDLDKEIMAIINAGVTATTPVETKKVERPVVLSADQQRAKQDVLDGHNVFITGNAGSGKSLLIAEIMRELEKRKRRVVLTASTGVAAWNIGGVTTHSFAGMGLADKDVKVYTGNLKYKPEKAKEWKETDVLIIDEISMLSVDFLEKLDAMAKFARQSRRPLGGIQLIMVGDYFQCPSVEKERDEDDTTPRFPFQAPLWKHWEVRSIGLKENFRQQNDRVFFDLLERVKVAATTAEDEALLATRLLERHPDVKSADLIKLCSRRATAEAINREELGRIDAPPHRYTGLMVQYNEKGVSLPAVANGATTNKLDRYPVDVNIVLKVGAEVMLCVNMAAAGLFNGSRGTVLSFLKDPELPTGTVLYPFVRFENGVSLLVKPNKWECYRKKRLTSTFTQIPLILRYAITIHKSQGLTLHRVLISMDFFENGQGYVAKSRVQSLDDLYLHNVDMKTIKASQAVIDFYTHNHLL